ncbi:MAG: 50S ribosomal protein L24 [Kiritimatiellae bacterium]|jgi:large subunit ribosomal protein L24|nr:50S ribosomal protein L24 [Kiritimatiellia bacterium]
MSIARIKKGDTVYCTTGESAGLKGKVLKINVVKGVAFVEGLNMVKKAMRPSEATPQGGFIEREAPIHLSNLMPYEADQKQGVRISRVREGDKTVRKSKASGKSLD